MRAKGIPVQQIILGLALLAGLCWNLAHASEINDLRVSAGATGTRAEIGLDSQVEYKILRSEEHTSELQSLMRISYAVFCLKQTNNIHRNEQNETKSQQTTN